MNTRSIFPWLLIMLAGAQGSAPAVRAQSTIAAASPHAWSANAGYIVFRHDSPAPGGGIVVGDAVLSGLAWSANCGWIDFGDGTPANGCSYSNGGSTDHGVNHLPGGALSGLAWGANIGWISFGQGMALSSPCHPRVNYLTGAITGHAWSANCGWIDLASNGLKAAAIKYSDGDGDGIADAWEVETFGNLTTANAASDADADGMSDKAEFIALTDPFDGDSRLRVIHFSEDSGINRSRIEFTTSPARMYRIETSADLAVWAPFSPALNYFAPAPDAASTHVLLDHAAEIRLFCRPVAVLPLGE